MTNGGSIWQAGDPLKLLVAWVGLLRSAHKNLYSAAFSREGTGRT